MSKGLVSTPTDSQAGRLTPNPVYRSVIESYSEEFTAGGALLFFGPRLTGYWRNRIGTDVNPHSILFNFEKGHMTIYKTHDDPAPSTFSLWLRID